MLLRKPQKIPWYGLKSHVLRLTCSGVGILMQTACDDSFGQTSRTPLFRKICHDIVNTMNVSETEITFGPATDPQGVDVALPKSIKAGYLERCGAYSPTPSDRLHVVFSYC